MGKRDSKCCCQCVGGESSESTESEEYDSTDLEIEENMLNHRRAQNSRMKQKEKRLQQQQAKKDLKMEKEAEGSGGGDPNSATPHSPTKKLNARVKYFSEHTTLHGLDQVYTSGSLTAKTFWFMVLLAVMGIVIWQMYKIITFFLEAHTLTSISVVYPEDGLEFPSFTICPLVKFNATRLEDRYGHIEHKVAEFSQASFISAYSTSLMDVTYFGENNTEQVINNLQEELNQNLEHSGSTLREFVEDATFDCKGQFLYCWFENGDLFDCCNPDTEKHKVRVKRYLLHSGPCFEFESLGLKQRLPGPVGGFGFVYWYPNNHVQKTVFNSYDEHALHMFTSPTEAMLEKSPVALPVGTHAHVSLQATKMTRQLEDQLGRTMCSPKNLTFFDEYSYPSCQAECLIDGMLRECNCTGVSTYAKLPPEARICSPKEAFWCFKRLAKQFTHMLTQCRKEKCSEACMYWKYKSSLTVGKVFRPGIEEEMINYWRLPTDEHPSNSLVIADIYFDDIEYTDIQQMPAVTIESFISNIGGAMGLWTGASIITWIHLCFFCVSAWCMHREERVERKSIRKASRVSKKRASSRTKRRVANDPDFPLENGDSSHRDLPDGSSLARQKLRNSKIILTPPYNDYTTDIVV